MIKYSSSKDMVWEKLPPVVASDHLSLTAFVTWLTVLRPTIVIQSLEALSLKFHTSHARAEQELTSDANTSFRVIYMFNAFIASSEWCWVSTVCLLCGSYFLVEVQWNLGFEARYETNNFRGLTAHTNTEFCYIPQYALRLESEVLFGPRWQSAGVFPKLMIVFFLWQSYSEGHSVSWKSLDNRCLKPSQKHLRLVFAW